MRRLLIASAAMLGVAMAGPAFAQSMTSAQYLEQAKTAIQNHQRYTAIMAVNDAENALVRGEAVRERHSPRDVSDAEPSVVREIGRAREAIQQSHWNQAIIQVDAALTHPSTSTAMIALAAHPGAGQIGSKE